MKATRKQIVDWCMGYVGVKPTDERNKRTHGPNCDCQICRRFERAYVIADALTYWEGTKEDFLKEANGVSMEAHG